MRLLRRDTARWTYGFEPDASGQGCTVTEEWTDRLSVPYRIITGLAVFVCVRPTHDQPGMALAHLEAAVETGGR